jgi:hypothetical protein
MKNVLAVLLLCSFIFFASATTHTTNSFGFWNDSYTWVGGIVPSYASSDTFYINHPVAIENNIDLLSGGFMKIDTNGGICGHHTFYLESSAIETFGLLELDSLILNSGVVNAGYGYVTLTLNAHIYGAGAGLAISGAGLAVGPWFECSQPYYSFTLAVEEKEFFDLKVFPNPSNDHIVVSTARFKKDANLVILSPCGQILKLSLLSAGIVHEIDISDLAAGLYLINLSNQKVIGNTQFIKY